MSDATPKPEHAPVLDQIEKAWRAQYVRTQELLDKGERLGYHENVFDAQDMRDAFGHGYRAALALEKLGGIGG